MLGSKKKEEAFPVNEALLNVITPMGLEIKRNSLVIGENLGSRENQSRAKAAMGGAKGTLDGFLPVMLFPGQATGI